MKSIFSKKQAGRIANHVNLLIMLIMVQTFFVSCDKEDLPDNTQAGTEVVVFNMAFAPQTRVSTGADFSSAWQTGDEVGLFAVSYASGTPAALAASGNYIDNAKLTRGSTGTWTALPAIYYAGGKQLDFYAYYPHQDVSDATGMTFTVQTDQSAATNFAKSDLLLAKQADIAKSAAPVTLTFSHALSLVQVEVNNATAATTVTLLNVKPSATIDWTDATVTATGATTGITMSRVSGTNLFRALVPPQDVAAGNLFKIDGAVDIQTGAVTFVQGGVKKYSF